MATLCVPYAPAVAPQGNKTSPPCRPKFPYHFGPLGLAQPEQIMPSSNLRVGSGIYGLSASKRPPAVFTSDGAPKSEASNEGTREQRTGQDMGCVPRSSFVAPTDPEIEALIRRISENVVIRDMAIKSPKYVQVPNGYSMDCGITPSEFYATRKEVRNHAKKRKREAAVPNINMSRRELADERHGFRAEEVNRNGAISIQDCKPSTLSNDIHPLFDRSNFDDTPDAIYDQLIPALQLASMFLMQPICMQYWVTLAMGHRADDAEMSAKNGKLSQRIASHVELTLERAQSVIAHIKGIGKSNLIHFRFKHGLYGDRAAGVAWGLSDPICDYQGIERDYHGLKGSFVRSIIRIHADYYVIAKKLSQLKYQEVSQKLRFSFNFAVLVMHEVVGNIPSHLL